MKKTVSQPRIRKSFEKVGADAAVNSSSEAYEKLMKSEYERYVKLIKDVGLTPQ